MANPFAGILTKGGSSSGSGDLSTRLSTSFAAADKQRAAVQAAQPTAGQLKSRAYLATQKNAKPIKPEGAFGNTGWGGALSKVNDVLVGTGRVAAGVVNQGLIHPSEVVGHALDHVIHSGQEDKQTQAAMAQLDQQDAGYHQQFKAGKISGDRYTALLADNQKARQATADQYIKQIHEAPSGKEAVAALGNLALTLGTAGFGASPEAQAAESTGKLVVGKGTQAAAEGASKLIPNAIKVAKAAAGGAAYNTASTGIADVGAGKNTKQIVKDLPKAAVTGGALGAGGELAGLGIGALASKISEHLSPAGDATASALGTATAPHRAITEKVPTVAEGDTKQAVLNQRAVQQAYQTQKENVQKLAQGMSEKDIKLIEGIETTSKDTGYAARRVDRIAATADNPEQFKQVVGAIRSAYNGRLASDRAIGRDVGEHLNYLPHIYDHTDTKTAQALERLRLSADSTPGYTKGRIIPTYAAADRIAVDGGYNLKRANSNVLEDFYQSMDRAGNDHGSAVLKKGLEQAHPGVKVGVGKIGFDAESGKSYEQLMLPGAKNLSLPSDLAKQYNKRVPAGASDGALGVYDKANAAIKQAKLGGGLFHGLTTALSSLGQGVISGHPVQALGTIRDAFSKTAFTKHIATLASNTAEHADGLSTLERANNAGVTMASKDIQADTASKLIDKIPGIKPLHDAVFQRQIPSAKLTIFEQATKGLDSAKPEDVVKMQQVANAVNKLGGINRAVEGLTPKTAKGLSRVLLATDFTEGKFRTLGAALDLAHYTPENKIARQLVVGKSIVAAIPGLTALTLAGNLDWGDPKAVASAIENQILMPNIALGTKGAGTASNPGGTPRIAKLPATFISELASVIKPALDPLSPNRLAGVKDYASARLAALPSTAEQIGTNRDYFGNPIYGNDKNGNPIGPVKTAANIGDQILPIPAVQTTKALSGQSLEESALNVGGLRVSNDPNSAQGQKSQKITDFYNTYNHAITARSQASKQITKLVLAGKVNEAKRKADEYNSTIEPRLSTFKSRYKDQWNPAFDTQFKTLPIPTSDKAFKARAKSGAASKAVLQ